MSKSLRNMSERERNEAVSRRLSSENDQKKVKGLGYWAARDYTELVRLGKIIARP